MYSQLWWMTYLALRNSFLSSEALVYVCVCVCPKARPSTSLSCLSYGGMSVGGRAVHSPVTSPPCLLLFVSVFLQRPHLVFLIYPPPSPPPPPLCILALLFRPQKCLSQQKPEAVRRRKAALPSHTGPLSLFTGRPAKSHLCLFLCFWGINVLLWQARLWWTC